MEIKLAAIDWAKANPADAKTVVNGALKELAGSTLSAAVLDRAFSGIELTTDPVAAEFPQLAQDSVDLPRLSAFVDTFAQGPQTPELGAPCTGGMG